MASLSMSSIDCVGDCNNWHWNVLQMMFEPGSTDRRTKNEPSEVSGFVLPEMLPRCPLPPHENNADKEDDASNGLTKVAWVCERSPRDAPSASGLS